VPYRGSTVRMGGDAVLGVQKVITAEAGVSVGDTLRIQVSNDDVPREIETPDAQSPPPEELLGRSPKHR
jgi:hypothetical protein